MSTKKFIILTLVFTVAFAFFIIPCEEISESSAVDSSVSLCRACRGRGTLKNKESCEICFGKGVNWK